MGTDPRIPGWLSVGREAIAAFERSELHYELRSERRDWWTGVFEENGDPLQRKIEEVLTDAEAETNGCLVVAGKTPKRLSWKGRRLYAYQLVCVGLGSVLPAGSDVVRHTCNNRFCVNPDHLMLGTQRENIMDERLRRYRGR